MSMKLPNGYGSVTKLSGNRRNPYMARVTLGRDDYGQLVRKTLGYYHTRKEALAALADYNRDPYDLSAEKVTFGQMYDIWYSRHETEVSPAVAKQYLYLYTKCGPVKDMPMADIKLIHLQTLLDNCGLTPLVIGQLRGMLVQVFDAAIKRDVVQINYAERADTPKTPKTKNPHVPFSRDEITLLWKHVDDKFVPCVLILIYTGMRESELVNMQTANIHMDDGYMIGGSKTDAGKNRIIPIHHKILPLIRAMYNPDCATLTDNTSRQLFEKRFAACMRRLGLSHRTHDCRHTFASLMDEAGANRSALKRIMGHAGGDVTDAVYIHKTVADLKQAIELITV